MIKGTGGPGHGGVAVFTRPGGRNMGRRFTDGIHVVMAAITTRDDTGVVESHVCPGGIGDMAVVAFGSCRHMAGRHAGGGNTIVATGTGTGNDRVIEVDLQPVAG